MSTRQLPHLNGRAPLTSVNHKQISTWGFCIGAPAIWEKPRRPTGRDLLSTQRIQMHSKTSACC
jgi:hypothetical protein